MFDNRTYNSLIDQHGSTSPDVEPASQTLSRGLRALEMLAESADGLTIDELSTALGLHRSITYRIVRTLEHHHLVRRDALGRVQLAPRLAALARNVDRDLQSASVPVLTQLARDLAMTAFVAVLDGDECVTLVGVEPPHSLAAVAQRPGTRHPLSVGAPAIAIQAMLSPAQWREIPHVLPRPELDQVRARGWATSHDEVIPGLRSVAVPMTAPGRQPAALALVYISSDRSAEALADALQAGVNQIAAELG
jgi:DNA-binding IclR family transcriptional regulator